MGWKGKLVFMLIVYFAGFATAVYCLGPAPDSKSGGSARSGSLGSGFKSEEFAKSLNSGMHKAIDMGKEAAVHAAKMIREKVNETQGKSGG